MNRKRFLPLFLLLALILFTGVSVAGLEPCPFFNYEGVLRDSSDRPLTGAYDMVFRLFDDPDLGEAILTDSHFGVVVSGGLFNVEIGSGSVTGETYLPKVFAEHGEVYLEVEVAGEVLLPRIPVLSAPQAMNARYVNGLEVASTGPLDLYVDKTTGDDSNSGLSPSEPKETIQAAADRIPMMLTGDVTVHIAAGTYAENILIRDRITPGPFRIRLVGEPDAAIVGSGTGIGIEVRDIAAVTLENLEVSGFHQGILVSGSGLTLIWCDVSGNGSNGISAWDKVVLTIQDGTTIVNNGNNGIRCGRAFLVLQGSGVATRPRINGNGANGISAELACGVAFWGPAEISSNGVAGIHVLNGGHADLAGRSDVTLSGNVACELEAGVHSTVQGYANAVFGGPCVCDDSSPYAVCAPGVP